MGIAWGTKGELLDNLGRSDQVAVFAAREVATLDCVAYFVLLAIKGYVVLIPDAWIVPAFKARSFAVKRMHVAYSYLRIDRAVYFGACCRYRARACGSVNP